MRGKADVDIVPDHLREFAGSGGPRIDLESLKDFADLKPAGGAMDESKAFGTTLDTSTQAIRKFLTEVQQGFNAYRAGAGKMADTYDTTEDRVTTTLRQIPSRVGDLPEISPQLLEKRN